MSGENIKTSGRPQVKARRARQPSLRVFIAATLSGMVVLTAGAVLFNAYLAGRQNAETVMEGLTRSTVARTTARVVAFLDPARDAALVIAEHLASGTLDADDPEQLHRYFFDVMQVETGLANLGFGDEAGNWVMATRTADGSVDSKTIRNATAAGAPRRTHWRDRAPGARYGEVVRSWDDPDDSYDPRQRPWYLGAQSAKGPHWTDAYVFYTSRAPGITVSVPWFRDGQLVGVVCVDISLTAVSQFLAELRVGSGGSAVLFDARQRLLASPVPEEVVMGGDGEELVLRPMAESRIAPIAALGGALGPPSRSATQLDSARAVSFEASGEPWVGSAAPIRIGGLHWTIGVAVPEVEFLGPIHRSNTKSIITSAILVLIALAVSILLARWIARSLDLLVRETDQIRQLRFDERTPESSPFREVSQVLRAFEDMKVGLRSFQKYLPVKLVRKLLEEQTEPTLGGEFMELTIYFSDIEGFTPINEQMHPMEMATRLGTYLATLTEIIEEEQGTVVQYVGDEVMAFWGAPQPVPDHAEKAARAALRCHERVLELWDDPSVPIFHTRFGIHTARVAVGHFGSTDRLYYGAIGDGINLTSRLEGLNKYYGTGIILTGDTRAQLSDDLVVRRLDRVAVKGKALPVTIYELLGPRSDWPEARTGWIDEYEAALEDYFAGRFGAALRGFRGTLAARPDDRPSQLMAERCKELLESPPSKGWTGVHVMTMK